MKLILGSASPRRKEILSFFSIPFEQAESGFDEDKMIFEKDPEHFAKGTARNKALHLIDKYPNRVILTADTVVHKGDRVFLKPKDYDEAFTMLKELSGKPHSVYTAVSIAQDGKLFTEAEETKVTFEELTDSQIDRYIKALRPFDKAGGYAIQKSGSLIVKRIDGCYYNVMGLPIHTVCRLLKKAGIDLWDHL